MSVPPLAATPPGMLITYWTLLLGHVRGIWMLGFGTPVP
jgi:hypothetical protein